jgi:hypothetical protein
VVLTDPQQGIEVVDLPALSDPELQAVMALEPVRRISKDLKDSARQLSRRQATYLVTLYYQIQGFRIRAENQERASAAAEQPNDFVHWTNQQMGRVEQVIATALDSYSTFHPLGQWAKSIDGIGKIIAAGFLAILDEAPPPTVGHWWRFAGLDPTLEWLGTERAGKVVTEVMGTRKDVTPADLVAISQLTNRSLESLRRFALSEKGKPSEDEMRKLLNVVVARSLRPTSAGSALDSLQGSHVGPGMPTSACSPGRRVSPSSRSRARKPRPTATCTSCGRRTRPRRTNAGTTPTRPRPGRSASARKRSPTSTTRRVACHLGICTVERSGTP